MSSPLPYISIFLVYLLLVRRILPAYMENRKPMDISLIIRAYNIFQVLACTYFVWKFGDIGFSFKNTWKCVDEPVKGKELESYNTVWWFTMLRTAEFLETIFFCLRKKMNQVSFLHVYHHISTIMVVWVGLKYQLGKRKKIKISSKISLKSEFYPNRNDGDLHHVDQLMRTHRHVLFLLL